jgi:hypothetical protein
VFDYNFHWEHESFIFVLNFGGIYMSDDNLGSFYKPYESKENLLFEVIEKIRDGISTLVKIVKLPVANLVFELKIDQEDIGRTHKYFTKPHPTYKIFKNKSLGAELIPFSKYLTRSGFLNSMKMKNRAGRYVKRAMSRGYEFVEIDRNEFIDDIHGINTSSESRQGRAMDASYLKKVEHFDTKVNFRYFGVLNADGRLVAYCNVGFYGNFYAIEKVIGHRNNDGVMHLLIVETVCRLIDAGNGKYLMYDTYFGASPNMRSFKSMFGFEPFRVKYSIQ